MFDFDYETLKMEAKEQGVPVKDLLALSPTNDPFYVGSEGQREKAEWFAKVYKAMGSPDKVHIRRVHYWLVSQDMKKPDGSKYMNTENDWNYITLCAKYARYLGLIPIENIEDHKAPDPDIHCYTWRHENPTKVKQRTDATQIIRQIANNFQCFNPSKTQKYMLELWCEKSTMNDILLPLCQDYGMNLVIGEGELSITAVNKLMDRIEEVGKPTRIFYISDFDPAGECMPVSIARKIEFLASQRDITEDIKLKQLVLTPEQCREYKLPRTPIKLTEKRAAGFEERHGAGATELDALEAVYPGKFKKIIEQEVLNYIDIDAWNKAVELNQQVKAKVRGFLQSKVGNVLAELDVSEFDDPKIEEGDVQGDREDDNWLFENQLEYLDQLEKYKEFKSRGGG